MSKVNKLVRNGQVAVLYSPGYGAGWYTWNLDCPDIIFDPGLVDLVEREETEQIFAYLTLKWPDVYIGGADQLTIKWLPEGTLFRIEETDGNEQIVIKEDMQWIVA